MAQSNDFIVKNGLVVKTTATIQGIDQSSNTSTGALVVLGGVGIGSNLNVGGTVVGGGVRTHSTSTAPSGATVGDLWYNITNDVIYRYTNDGVGSAWIDISGATSNPFYGGHLVASSVSILDSTPSISTESGALTVVGGVGVQGTIYASNIYSNGILLGPIGPGSTSTANIAGGEAGQIPYQANTNVTTFFGGSGSEGKILVGNGTNVPLFISTLSVHVGLSQYAITATNAFNLANTGTAHVRTAQYAITATNAFDLINTGTTHVATAQYAVTATYAESLLNPGTILVGQASFATTATNLAEGTAGQLPYQVEPGITGFVGPGEAGQLLMSSGTNAPVYVSTGSIQVRAAQYAVTATVLSNTASIHVRTAQFAVTATNLSNTGSIFVGRATTATHIAGGARGSIPYQLGTGTTTFLPLGSSGTVLIAGATDPQWYSLGNISAGSANTATNLASGTPGQIPYQISAGLTGFIGPGITGQLLMSSGTNTPSYTTTGTIHVGVAQYAVTATNLNSTGTIHIRTAQFAVTATNLANTGSINVGSAQFAISATNAVNISLANDGVSAGSQYLTFASVASGYSNIKVDSNKITYVPSTGVLTAPKLFLSGSGASTSTTSSNALYVAGGAYIQSLFVSQNTTFAGNVTFNGGSTYVYSTNTVYTDNILELHMPPGGVGTPWTTDDGKNIGLRFHYYKDQNINAFFGLSNTSGYLEWYDGGANDETTGFADAKYGGIKSGTLILTTSTNATSTTTGALQVAGGISVAQDVWVAGNIYSNNELVGAKSTTATNIKGGEEGSIPIQSADGITSFISPGAYGFVLTAGVNTASWVAVGELSAGNASTATNLQFGTTGQIPYQYEPGVTLFFGPGTNGQLLMSKGAQIPEYTTTGTIHVGVTQFAVTATTATYASIAFDIANTASTHVGTAQFAVTATTATYASIAFDIANTASTHVGTAQFAVTATTATYASIAFSLANTASIHVGTAQYAVTATNLSNTASIHVGTAQYAVTATNLSNTASIHVGTAQYAVTATNLSNTASIHVGTAQYAVTATNLSDTSSIFVGFATKATMLFGGAAGYIPYQSDTDITEFLPLGTGGYVLTAGSTAPQWAAVSGLSAGNANTATNINGGLAGQLVYQFAPSVTAFVTTGTTGQVLISQGARAPKYSTTVTSLVVSNNLTHGGLIPSEGLNIDQIYTTSTSLTLTEDWQDIGVNGSQLATGSYMVQCIANDDSVGGYQVNTYYSGVMSWYSGATSEDSFDEIILHRAGTASGIGSIYLQVLRTTSGMLSLQIAGNTNNASVSTYNFKFRRMI